MLCDRPVICYVTDGLLQHVLRKVEGADTDAMWQTCDMFCDRPVIYYVTDGLLQHVFTNVQGADTQVPNALLVCLGLLKVSGHGVVQCVVNMCC